MIAVSDLTRPVEWRAAAQERRDGGPSRRHRACRTGHRRGRLRPGQPAGDRGTRRGRARGRHPPSGLRLLDPRPERAGRCRASLTEADEPQPTDAYGRSKLAAEEAVRAVGRAVHDPAAGPDLRPGRARQSRAPDAACAIALAAAASALCRNRRSLLARQNLIGAIHLALGTPAAIGETYIVADPEPLTLAEIVAALRAGEGRGPGLLPVPAALLAACDEGAGPRARNGSASAARWWPTRQAHGAGWQPAIETRDGLMAMAQAASPRKSGTASRSTP